MLNKQTGFTTFFDAIVPSFERNVITSQLSRIFKETDELLLPNLEIDESSIRKTDSYQALAKELKGNDKYRGKVVDYLKDTLKRLLDGRTDFESMIEKNFNSTVHKEGLDYKRAQILMLVNHIDFLNRYIMEFLLLSTREALGSDYYAVKPLNRTYVMSQNNLKLCAAVCGALEKKPKEYGKVMRRLEGITIDEETREMTEANLGDDIDPFKANFHTVDYNIFYLVGKVYNALYVFWFEFKQEQAAKLTQQVAKLRLRQRNGTPEEAEEIDRILKYHDDRLNRLKGEIQEELADASGD